MYHNELQIEKGNQLVTSGNSDQPEIHHEFILHILWRRRWTSLILLLASLATAFFYVLKATPIYTSTSRLYVERRGPKIISEQEGMMSSSNNYLYTQCELLKSTPILSKAIANNDFRSMKTLSGIDNPVGFLKESLSVKVGNKDDIISVSLNSPYPEEAAQLVNAIVEAYVCYHSEKQKDTAGEILKILQKEKIKQDKELTVRLKALMDYKLTNSDISFIGEKENVIFERLGKLSEALTAAQLETINARADLETYESIAADPEKIRQIIDAQRSGSMNISESNEANQMRTELTGLQLQLVTFRHDLNQDHRAVKAIQARIEEIEKRLADLEANYIHTHIALARQRLTTAMQKEKQIAGYLEEQRNLASSLNIQMAKYTMLQSAWEQTKKLCDILDNRIKEINITEDTGALNITILEVARAESKPTFPKKGKIISMAFFLGILLGLTTSLIQDFLDHRLRNADDISRTIRLPVLGIVPAMSSRESIAARGTKVHQESSSVIAEAYRTIRTAIYFGAPQQHTKTILITSPSPGDGKSTFTSNLAITMAQAGQHILIIDADFRKPILHKIFEIDPNIGFTNLLSSPNALEDNIHHTSINGLDILPCGPIPSNPSEILNSTEFGEIIDRLTSRYDRVIIDSPPVMPVTDARILGAQCDLTIMILRADKSIRKTTLQARDGLLSVGAHLLGVVVNAVPQRRNSYGYYSGYGYGDYGYCYGEKPYGDTSHAHQQKHILSAVTHSET
jgi:capsular exopolysaccharide synthesis family protein